MEPQMYLQFFGVSRDAFGMTPDPAFLFLTVAHREALAGLTYAILARKGLVVLTGDAGTGKTTMLTRILQAIPVARARFGVVLNPTLSGSEFLELVLQKFGISEIPTNKTHRLTIFENLLLEAHQNGQVTALIVDEAHKLSPHVLEELRLLSNFELADHKLLQIVLAGQTELGTLLNDQALHQLKQRFALRFAIQSLSSADVQCYIQHRWQKAGGTRAHPFQAQAVHLIADYSRGIPRLINVICFNALMLAYGEGSPRIRPAHILQVASTLDLIDIGSANRGQPDVIAPAETARSNGLADGISITGSLPITPAREHSKGTPSSRLLRLKDKLGFTTSSVEH